MPKLLKRLFKNGVLNNQRGSSLSITIVVIAVLAFSVTTITNLNVNLSGATQQELENINEESIAKGYITKTIDDYKLHIEGGGTFSNFTPISNFNIISEDVTDTFTDFGDINGVVSQVIKFGIDLSIGHTIYKYVYITEGGVAYGTDEPFDFAIGTEGDLILNGGLYDDISLFGNNIYIASEAPWYEERITSDYWGLEETYHVTPGHAGTLPVFTYGGNESLVHYTDEYNYCTSDCWIVDEAASSIEETASNINYLQNTTINRTLDFGATYANEDITLTFNISTFGAWESSGSYIDYFHFSVNGSHVETHLYGDGSTYQVDDSLVYSLTLDGNGQVQLGFESDVSGSGEYMQVYGIRGSIDNAGTQTNEYVIDKGEYGDVTVIGSIDKGDIQPDRITSFFNSFDFEEFVDLYAGEILPTDNRQIAQDLTLDNFETVIRNNMDPIEYRGRRGRAVYPTTAYTDISNDSRIDFNSDSQVRLRTASVYDTYNDTYWDPSDSEDKLTIWDGVRLNDWDEEGLIVLGDLEINNGDSYNEELRGTYIVTGDLILTGERLDFKRCTFIVFGETRISMDRDYGFYTTDNSYELSILGKDNIHLDYQWEDYGNFDPTLVSFMLYTEESIVVNSVLSKVVMEGALFAAAKGNSNNPIPYKDELGNQINGIVINSYRGYVNRYWQWDGFNGTYVKGIQYQARTGDDYNRFKIVQVPANQMSNTFFNVPEFGNVTVGGGEASFETSEWKVE